MGPIRKFLLGNARTDIVPLGDNYVIKIKVYPGLLKPMTWLPIVWTQSAYLGRNGTLAFITGGAPESGTEPLEFVIEDPDNYQFASRGDAEEFLRIRTGERRKRQAGFVETRDEFQSILRRRGF